MPVNEAQREFDALATASGDTNVGSASTSTHPEDLGHSTSSRPPSPASHDDTDNDIDNDHLAPPRPSAGSTIGNPAHMPHSTASAPVGVMPTYHIPSTIFDANTGPKGVIADAQSFEKARRRTFRQTLHAFSNGLGFSNPSGSSGSGPNARKASRSPNRGNNITAAKKNVNATTSTSSTDASADEDEDEFMRTWRAKRMAEMEQGAASRTRRQSPSKRRFGHLTAVDPVGYLDAVEKVAADTVVVVLIADDESPLSSITENALSDLARKHEFTRFVKMSCADAEMDRATVPAVLAYRAGELIANLVSLVDEIPQGRSMSAASLEGVLQRHKVLS